MGSGRLILHHYPKAEPWPLAKAKQMTGQVAKA